jgi:hypothetical protein
LKKKKLEKAEERRASVEVAIAGTKKLIERHETKIAKVTQLLEAARVRLGNLESGAEVPQPPRKPKPGDHVASPKTGSLGSST